MADKKENKKFQFLIFGICSLAALVVCMVVLVITARSVEKSNSSVVEYETKSKTELTDDTQVLSDYLKTLTQKAAGNKFIKADVYTEISVDDSQLVVCDLDGNESETDKNIFVYAKNKMMSCVDAYYPEDFNGVFGTVYDGMPTIDLPVDSITASSFSVGEADADGNPVYNSDTGELIDSDYYFIKLNIDCSKVVDNAIISDMFSLSSKQETVARLEKDLSSVCTVNKSEIIPFELSVNAKVNRLSDEIEYINFERIYDITADVTFINELKFFGGKRISFQYKVNEKFEYHYAGIKFSESSVTVEPGDEVSLSVNAVIEDDSDYTVTFTSSDSTVATVDEMGYVKGIKESGTPVTVTVKLEYLGETFTDECLVYVGETDEISGS